MMYDQAGHGMRVPQSEQKRPTRNAAVQAQFRRGLKRYRPPHDTGILPEMQLSLKSRPANSDLSTVMRADIKQRGKIAAKGCAQIPLCTMYAVACMVHTALRTLTARARH